MRMPRSFVTLGFAASLGAWSSVSASAQNPADDVWLQSFLSPGTSSFLTAISFGSLQFSENNIGFDLRQFTGIPVGPSLFFYRDPGDLTVDMLYTLHPNV